MTELNKARIIPARAGFTVPGKWSTMGTQDHPRSRGVYMGARALTSSPEGSSPLARGLHSLPLVFSLRLGIIPARAGFTMRWTAAGPPTADHPRSRGVYLDGGRLGLPCGGSSPLARGLPLISQLNASPPGIIPARAGFTHLPSLRW